MAAPYRLPPPVTLTPFSLECMGRQLANYAQSAEAIASSSWGTANLAWTYQFTLHSPAQVQSFFWFVGAASAGNIDLGIYTLSGRKVITTGATAAGAANTLQVVAVTPTWIPPGTYRLAASASSNTMTCFSISTTYQNAYGRWEPLIAASSHPLPATLSMAGLGNTILTYAIGAHFRPGVTL